MRRNKRHRMVSLDRRNGEDETEGCGLVDLLDSAEPCPSQAAESAENEATVREAGLPLFDLYPEFVSRGDPMAARWKYDGHWNPTGHSWAAEGIASFLLQEPARWLPLEDPEHQAGR